MKLGKNPGGLDAVGQIRRTGAAKLAFVSLFTEKVGLPDKPDVGAGSQVFDISDPSTPVPSYTCVTIGHPYDVAVAGEYAFVADFDGGLTVVQTDHRHRFPDEDVGQSLAIDGGLDTIVRARLTSTETPDVSWEMSADGGTGWTPFSPDGAWTRLDALGYDLVWRADLDWSPGLDPMVSELTTHAVGV